MDIEVLARESHDEGRETCWEQAILQDYLPSGVTTSKPGEFQRAAACESMAAFVG